MYGMTAKQREALLALQRCGKDVTVRKVAEQLGCRPATAWSHIKKLVKKGIISNPFTN